MTNIVTSLKDWQDIRKSLRDRDIGFVPTMGNLHLGHISLCERAAKENEITVVSIFVNPTQFNLSDDFINYPRTISADLEKLQEANVNYALLFDEKTLYHDNYEIKVCETTLSKILEGEYRPGHFDGVLTIVLKFLNLVQPKHCYFGEKDYQQLLLIKKMVAALFIPTEVVACKTIRDHDALALSSRNSRLTADQRKQAASFPQVLNSNASIAEIEEQLKQQGFKIDYIAEAWQRRLGAVWLDKVRLIDNVEWEA